jgi:hypothetical protein
MNETKSVIRRIELRIETYWEEEKKWLPVATDDAIVHKDEADYLMKIFQTSLKLAMRNGSVESDVAKEDIGGRR